MYRYQGTHTTTAVALLAVLLGSIILGAFPREASAGTVVVYLTSGTSWAIPNNWNNSNNTVEVIGAGGGGGSANNNGSSGGGGGGYSKVTNLNLSGYSTITYQVGTAGSSNAAGGDTFFHRTSGSATACTAGTMSVCAKGGSGGTYGLSFLLGGAGGAASSGIGDVKYSGGKGGDAGPSFFSGGGGGAAGPNGDGNAGTNASSSSAVAGGSGDAGFGGAGGAGGATPGNPGAAGTEWATHGSGGGGGGCLSGTAAGGTGGAYGGGGGGACQQGGSTGGAGLIRITYEAPAAKVDVDTTGNASVSWGASRRVVYTSTSNAYLFYRDSGGTCVYTKSTDGGFTWGSAVTVDSQTDCLRITVWYDQWTPGDTSGTYIHIVTSDSGSADLWYTRLDTSSDTLTTTVNATGANQGGSFAAGANPVAITKGTDGTIYMAASSGDSYVIECSSTCTSAGNWTETGTNPLFTSLNPEHDYPILLPLSGGDILLILHRQTAGDVLSKKWNNSSWDASWTTFDPDADFNLTYDTNISATVDSTGSTVYLAYLANNSTFDANNDDLRTATYSSGSWATTTAILTNTTDGLSNVTIGLSGSDVYVVYARDVSSSGATLTTPCIALSSNTMSTWRFSACVAAFTGSTRWDIKDMSMDANSTSGALGVAWFDDTSDDQMFYVFPGFNSSNTLTFTRDVWVSGGIAVLGGVSKGSGTFVIDHPLDPKNKLLYHSFVESPDVKNIYDGITELNRNGEATVALPGYFIALNKDYRYLATAIGEPMPNLHLKKEVAKRWWIFGKPVIKISGGAPNGRVSWQVTGIRHDPLIEAHPVEVEVEKGPEQIYQKGECVHKPLCD